MVLFAGKTVLSTPERFECTALAKKRYINTLPFLVLSYLYMVRRVAGRHRDRNMTTDNSDVISPYATVFCSQEPA